MGTEIEKGKAVVSSSFMADDDWFLSWLWFVKSSWKEDEINEDEEDSKILDEFDEKSKDDSKKDISIVLEKRTSDNNSQPKRKFDWFWDRRNNQWTRQSWKSQQWDRQSWKFQLWKSQQWDRQSWKFQTWRPQQWDRQSWKFQSWRPQQWNKQLPRQAWWSQQWNKQFWWSQNKSNNWAWFSNKPSFKSYTSNRIDFKKTDWVLKTPTQQLVAKKEYKPKTSDNLVKKTIIEIQDTISVKEFAEKMWVQLPNLLKSFLSNKIMVNINSTIDFDTASLIWEEFWVQVTKSNISGWISVEDLVSGNLQAILEQDKQVENLEERPPIVTIMWHVDHGKTKLLDYIRKTNIVSWEAWGITQSIWASQIIHNDKKITFIDTPWHELFTSLRARWAKITDIAVIVIASDDWIKQQTIEAISHAKEAWVPIMVAITKIDKWINNIEQIKSQMAEQQLIPEDWWGNIVMVPVSWVTWQWVNDLLDMILLQTEMLELKYNPNRSGIWVVVESNKDTKRWVTTSLIVMTWTMQVWDIVAIHNTFGKIRKMVDWKWEEIKCAKWWDPVMLLWIQDIPEPWRFAEVVQSEKEANNRIELIREKEHDIKHQVWIQNLLRKISSWEEVLLKLILKADSSWSLEALKYVTWKIELPENIELKIIHSDMWDITNSDIDLAHASDALIIWFNVTMNGQIKKKAESLKVTIKKFDIIYEIIDFIDRFAKWLIKPEEKEVYIGKLEVLWIFYRKASDMIVWGKVLDGKVVNNAIMKAYRKWWLEWNEDGNIIIASWKVTSVKKESENVKEVTEWHECWIRVKVSKKLVEWDILEFYVIE